MIPIIDLPEGEGSGPAREPGGPRNPDLRSNPTEQEIHDEISREVREIYEESYGRGAGSTETLIGDGWVIVILDQLELLPNEEFLVDNGKQDAVVHVRSQYQLAIQAPLRAAVERATGRKVTGFVSTTSVEEPRFAVEIFRLD